MRKPERRNHRSEKAHLALNLFLESVRKSEGIEALAVTTEDGFLVAGVGETDVEWMGALGASSRRATLKWDERTLHVQRVEVNRVPMFVTSAGRAAKAASLKAGFERILAS
ncbi:MAG: hypothetical protein Q8N23_20945 [Archangium sp.]|nr:hypothetical protein [Archangium sp.]MDP3155160.1 hypothetical protein [Archangium sp.]MDP3572524.1 hypothetical protein [Archangium sp.]